MKGSFRIRELRKRAGLTQAELARAMGQKSPSSVTMWESGERKPSSDILPKLAKVLNCSLEDLYEPIRQGDGQAFFERKRA